MNMNRLVVNNVHVKNAYVSGLIFLYVSDTKYYHLPMQNVAPEHTPDVVVYLDAISIVFEEASKNGPPLSLPSVCIEAGSDHCLPNLALRFLHLTSLYFPKYSIFGLTRCI